MLLCASVLLQFEIMPCLIANRYVVRVTHSLNSPRSSFRFNIASYTGSVLKDDVAVSGDVSQRPGPRVRTFLYDNTDSSKPISVSNSGSETELYVFFPFLAQGMRDQGYGSLTVRSSDAERGIWIMQVTDQICIVLLISISNFHDFTSLILRELCRSFFRTTSSAPAFQLRYPVH
jgi:hypothetical protein